MPTKQQVDHWTERMREFRARLKNLKDPVSHETLDALDAELDDIMAEASRWYDDA